MKNAIIWSAGVVILAVALSVTVMLSLTHSQKAGNISSPPSVLDYLQLTQAVGFGPLGGTQNVNMMAVRSNLVAASLIPCSLQNPFTSTSTVVQADFNVNVGTSSAAQLVFATSTTATATTSPIARYTVGAGQQFTLSISNATTTGISPVVGPSQYINVGTDSGSSVGYGYTFGGTCSAVFVQAGY